MKAFLDLAPSERRDILATFAPVLGFRPEALEKDIGICWALEVISTITPLDGRLALKGGTSLSKAYRLIDRFSEDIDLTMDYLSFLGGENPDLSTMGRNDRDRLAGRLEKALLELLLDSVIPCLNRSLPELSHDAEILFRPEDEVVVLKYPSVLEARGTYLREKILLEFGARNTINPSVSRTIEPLIGPRLPDIRMPTATIPVLKAERTFWEKATLIHVACNRGFVSRSAERQSRHWYDLAMLSRSRDGVSAMSDMTLLSDVLRIKKAFFNCANAKYDDCLAGKLRLIPDDADISRLQADYEAMIAGGMFLTAPPKFGELMEELSLIQRSINSQNGS